MLLRNRGDPEVQEFVAADLVAALQTGERKSFPRSLQEDEELWGALTAYYAAQQGLDQSRREARDLLAEELLAPASAEVATMQELEASESCDDAAQALQVLCSQLKSRALTMQSGTAKTGLMGRLGRCTAHFKAMQGAAVASHEAEEALRRRCSSRFDAYVGWVGSDRSFWLSFVRGCGNERTGGLLDALAKVCKLTVYVWAEKLFATAERSRVFEEPELELVHKATFGARTVHLWYQGDRGHFDKLVPYEKKRGSR